MKRIMIFAIIATMMSAFALTAGAQTVKKNADGSITMTYGDGSKKTFVAKRLSELTQEERQQVISGDRSAYDTKYVGLNGQNIRRVLVSFDGGIHYTNGQLAPLAGLSLGYDIVKNLSLVAYGEFSTGKYGEYAQATGNYPIFGFFIGGEWYFFTSQLAKFTNEGTRLGIKIAGGFVSGKTEDLSMEKSRGSEGQGGALEAAIKAQIHLKGRLYLTAEGGVRWAPHFEVDENLNWDQKFFDKGTGPYVKIGLAVNLSKIHKK